MAISNVIDREGNPVELAPDRGDLRRSSAPLMSWATDMPRTIAAIGKQISYAEIYATQPIIGAAIGWLLRQAIRVPLKTYRRTGDDSRVRLRSGQHRLATAIDAPWDNGSSYDLVASKLGPLLVHGNAIVEVDEGARNTLRFGAADWRFATPIRPWRDSIAGWKLDRDDPTIERTRGADQVLHTKWWSSLGPIGISPLHQLGVTLKIEDAAQRHQQAMLRNGARPPSAVIADKDFIGIEKEEREVLLKNLREDIESIYAGPENQGKPALLPPGLDWKQVGHTAVEAALIDQRLVSRAEMFAVLGVFPGVLGLVERVQELLEQVQQSVMGGLAPPLLLIETVINSQLVREVLREDDIYVEFDFGLILRGDRLKEIEALREAIASALMVPNEGRSALNLPKSDQAGMNEFYLPRNNLWPLSVPYPAKGMGGDPAATDPAAAAVAALERLAAGEPPPREQSRESETPDPAPVGA